MVKALLSRMNTSPEVFIALTMSDLSAPLTLVGSINGRIKDLFIAKFGGVVLNSADTIVISAFLGLTLLAVYQNYYFVMSSICGIMEMAYKLYDSCNGEKQLYIVHGADHSENYRKDPGGYEKIVTKFIEERIERKGD